ncbi:TPA: lipoprotein BUG3, partial [Streptococcus agalactiae]|nr:lipoprotein BUG3 [Streptococcus agalactiae]HEO7926466.1 lipoprotein BUG3 [Streptococcus agalactiae]HEO7938572.1 lipoprotein BUG3 [Streptococcus agalactiae]HEO7940690.1 lipoprotein BUG3 [Streptococcus agalactiae]HEO7946689.1 lipoprotein BUG3 [Streptococcus agalactiae]
MKKHIKSIIPIVLIGMILGGCQMNSEHKSQYNETK